MVNLEELYLAENKIEKIQGLDNLRKLVILDLSFNNLTNLNGLPEFEFLEDIWLSNNKLENYGDF